MMKYWVSFIVICLAVGGPTSVRLSAQQAIPPEVLSWADIVLYNGKILTADENFTIAEAVAIRDGKFLAIGETDRILAMAGPQTGKLDLKGKTVTPGILEMHGGPSGPLYRDWGQKWLPGEGPWRTKEEALEGIRRAVARAQPGETVVIPRTELEAPDDPARGAPPDFCSVFTLEELDAVSPNNPVFFVSVINTTPFGLNSKGAEVISPFMPKGVSNPFIGENIPCSARQSQNADSIPLPGQFASADYILWLEPLEQLLGRYRRDIRRFLSEGITLGKQHMPPPLMGGLLELWRREELEMRIRMPFPMVAHICRNSTCLPEGENAESFFRRWPNMSRIGDRMLRFTGMRPPAVGGNISWGTAWTLEPKVHSYLDPLGRASPYGGRVEEGENKFRGRDLMIQAVRYGWDVSCDHCEGDRAIREVVNAFEEGLKTQVVKRPDQRLTTNHTPLVHPDEIERMAELGIWSSISTGHVLGGTDRQGIRNIARAVYQLGPEYLHSRTAPFRSYIEAGLRPSLEGTMWTQAHETSAFFWISKAITRKDEHPDFSRVWNPAEVLTRQEALWASTLWSAAQLAEDKYLGSIEIGKEADLVVIDRDYMTVPEDDIKNTMVLVTIVVGKIVYEAPGALR